MLEVDKIRFSKADTSYGKGALGYVWSKHVSADTWHDCGVTLDDRWQVRHKVQIVGWDREKAPRSQGDANLDQDHSARANLSVRGAGVVRGGLRKQVVPDTNVG